jgi:hypothetical protein
VLEVAHAVVCERRERMLNEKSLVERARLIEWVDALRGQI